jgi:flagellar motor switch/type III secretory pathway protein FliN
MSSAVQNVQHRVEPIAPRSDSGEKDPLDSMPWLPCTISLQVPVVRFTIADLLSLREGSVVETACHYTSDVPLRVNGVLIGWSEFDVLDDRLVIRIREEA